MLNLNPAQVTQVNVSGNTLIHALVTKPIYTTKLDTFSYGKLMTHMLLGKCYPDSSLSC